MKAIQTLPPIQVEFSNRLLSLLPSHISQFQQQNPELIWSRIVDVVQTWNQNAGTITPNKISDDLLEAMKQKTAAEMPEEFKATQAKPEADWTRHPDAIYLALVVLIGAWEDKNQYDIEVVTNLLGIGYDEWLDKAREMLHCPDSPLSLKNGIWKVNNRIELWNLLGSRILDQNLDTFKAQVVSVLKKSALAMHGQGGILRLQKGTPPVYSKNGNFSCNRSQLF